jgi:hypothetical protein
VGQAQEQALGPPLDVLCPYWCACYPEGKMEDQIKAKHFFKNSVGFTFSKFSIIKTSLAKGKIKEMDSQDPWLLFSNSKVPPPPSLVKSVRCCLWSDRSQRDRVINYLGKFSI